MFNYRVAKVRMKNSKFRTSWGGGSYSFILRRHWSKSYRNTNLKNFRRIRPRASVAQLEGPRIDPSYRHPAWCFARVFSCHTSLMREWYLLTTPSFSHRLLFHHTVAWAKDTERPKVKINSMDESGTSILISRLYNGSHFVIIPAVIHNRLLLPDVQLNAKFLFLLSKPIFLKLKYETREFHWGKFKWENNTTKLFTL